MIANRLTRIARVVIIPSFLHPVATLARNMGADIQSRALSCTAGEGAKGEGEQGRPDADTVEAPERRAACEAEHPPPDDVTFHTKSLSENR